MREASQASLTEAVKMTAGASLTRMVKGAAGREPWPIDDPASTDSPPKRRALPTLIAACLCLGALAALAFVGVRGTATTTTLAFPETAAAPRATVPRRVALVIGNSAYRYTARLANPHNDAFDISRALRRRSFHVIEGFDLDKASFDTSIAEFSAALKNAEVGLFFYAGHGIQVGGHNYLAPIDARLTVVSALDNEMVRLEIVQRAMAGGAATNLLFLDACRDNPLARNLARAMGTRSPEIGPGLAAVESGAGTLISFSTQPGNVALDGTGRNSPIPPHSSASSRPPRMTSTLSSSPSATTSCGRRTAGKCPGSTPH